MATAAISAPAVKTKEPTIPVAARFLRVTHLLFLILVGVQFIPDHASVTDAHTSWLIWFAVIVEAVTLAISPLFKKKEGLNLFLDIIGFIYGFLILWTIFTAKLALLPAALFPPFGKILAQGAEDAPKILINIKSSVGIILQGFFLALVTAVPLGLFLGWNARLGSAATYLSKFFSSIPPIVYIPYGIALLPSFRSVSVFVIFLASFWPVFAGTMSGVLHVDSRILDSAKVLNVNKPTMLLSVILPASLNQIFLGCNQGLVRELHSADVRRDDRRTRRHGLLRQVLLRFWRLYSHNRWAARHRHRGHWRDISCECFAEISAALEKVIVYR